MGSVRQAGSRVADAVGETAHELSERAREVGAVTADYAERAGRYARDAGSATGAFVIDNAVPLSLIGIGIGWLALSLRQRSQERYIEDDRYLDDYDYDYARSLDADYELESGRPRFDRARRVAGDARSRVAGASQATRERLGGLAHEAQDRVEGLADEARQRAHAIADSARDAAGSVAESARELADGARSRASALVERASTGVDAARSRVTSAASQLSHQASELGHEARERARRAQTRTRELADENPLALGAIAIATGVGVGLLLPPTRPENELMGEARDRLLDDARGLLREARAAGDVVDQKARETVQDVRNAANEARMSH